MTPREKIVQAHRVWAALIAKADAPETEALRTVRREITLRLRNAIPNRKSYRDRYPWNSPKFDHYTNPEKQS
jgi:hypothetical protein